MGDFFTDDELTITLELSHGLIVLELCSGSDTLTTAISQSALYITVVDKSLSAYMPGIEFIGDIPNKYFHIAFVNVNTSDETYWALSRIKAPTLVLFNTECEEVLNMITRFNLVLVKDFATENAMKLYKR